MATIKSGASADVLTVDPTSKGARTVEYNPDGTTARQTPNGSFFLDSYGRLGIVTGGAAVALFAMRNAASRVIRFKRIRLQGGFTGTAAATESVLQVVRFSTATPSGGAAITPAKKDTTGNASTVADARDLRGTDNFTTGLTTTSVVFESIGEVTLVIPHQLGSSQIADESFGDSNDKASNDLVLQANEGLAIILPVASIAGVFYSAMFEWEEY